MLKVTLNNLHTITWVMIINPWIKRGCVVNSCCSRLTDEDTSNIFNEFTFKMSSHKVPFTYSPQTLNSEGFPNFSGRYPQNSGTKDNQNKREVIEI